MARLNRFTKLGPTQHKILMWLGEINALQNAPLRYDVAVKKAKLDVLRPDYRPTDSRATLRYVDEWRRQLLSASRQRNRVLATTGLLNAMDEVNGIISVTSGQIKVRWSAEKFLGHSPTRSESAILSDALAKLKGYGLVTLIDGTRGEGKKSRVRFIRLTPSGVERCKKFYEGLIEDRWAALLADFDRQTKMQQLALGLYEDDETSSLTR